MAQPTLEGPDGKPIVPKVTEDGAIKVSGGADGSELATEETQQDVKTAAEALASTVVLAPGALAADPGLNVKVSASVTLPVEIVAGQTASAQPADDAIGIVIRDVGLAPAEPVGEEGKANPVLVRGVAQISGEVSQGRGLPPDTSDPWIVKTSDGVDAKEIATKEGQDAIEAALGPKATTTDVQEVRDAVDELEVDADATRVAVESIDDKTPLGPANMVGARPIVFAMDHPPVPAELYVGGNPLSNTNPVFVRGIVPSRTPTGTPAAASSGQVGSDGAGALLYFRGHVESPAGTRYVLLFDAASGDALATNKLIPNVAFPVTVTLSRFEQRFGYPLSFASGLRWAVSTTEHTYTASVDTAYVFAQWIQL